MSLTNLALTLLFAMIWLEAGKAHWHAAIAHAPAAERAIWTTNELPLAAKIARVAVLGLFYAAWPVILLTVQWRDRRGA